MSLLAPLLLGLAAFASIPILLHLIRRKRVRVLELPTFRFLRKVAEQQRVRFRFQDQLLMMLRILILLLTALAFAGPLGGERTETADGPMLKPKNLLVLDDTLSMGVGTGAQETAYDAARRFTLKLVWETAADWEVGLASDFLGREDPQEFLARGYRETIDLLERRAVPVGRGTLERAIEKASALLDENTALWTVTEAAASNWTFFGSTGMTEHGVVETIRVPTARSLSNWAVTELSLNNQPLLANEPALLTSRFEYFGEGAPPAAPPEVVYGWRSGSGESFSEKLNPTIESGTPEAGVGATSWAVQTTIPSKGRIASVSSALAPPAAEGDALSADNRANLVPRFLEGVRILVAAESEDWAKTLRAALVGFDCEIANTLEPPTARAGSFSAYVFLLEREPPHPTWRELLSERVQSGGGVLFLYDAAPDAVRIGNWTDWWAGLESSFTVLAEVQSDGRFAPGGDRWFFDSLDPTALGSDWASGAFPVVRLEGWESELDLAPPFGERVPLFQTRKLGQGGVGAWSVPISPRATPLLYSTAWVPLLSQMVKRTLIDSEWAVENNSSGDAALESRLAQLTETELEKLAGIGYRFHSLDQVEPRLADLHQARRNWTALILSLCLALAVIEIGVSNYV